MKITRYAAFLALAGVTAIVGCNRHNDRADEALQTDLNLANQQTARQDSISALENGTSASRTSRTGAAAPASRTRASTARRSSGRVSSSNGSVGTSAAPTTTVQKNTKRDAAIGAAAGAIIGATTSRDKVKGGIIGAAAGGILGGVIGNNVDVKKKKKP